MKETPILFTPDHIRAILDDKKTQTRRVMNVPHKNDDGKIVMEQPFPDGPTRGKFRSCDAGGYWELWGPDSGDGRALLYEWGFPCHYGVPGDRMWVKEAWALTGDRLIDPCLGYKADGTQKPINRHIGGHDLWYPHGLKPISTEELLTPPMGVLGWRNAMFMPKWAARLWLEITDVRVERVQEISGHDSFAEGVTVPCLDEEISKETLDELAIAGYKYLWDSINGKRAGGVFAWDKNPFVWCISFRRIDVHATGK